MNWQNLTYLFDVPYLAILLNKGGKTKIDILLSPMVKPPAFFTPYLKSQGKNLLCMQNCMPLSQIKADQIGQMF